MNSVKINSIRYNISIICCSKHRISCLVNSNTPNPFLYISNFPEFDSFFIPECNLSITSCHNKIFPTSIESHWAWIKSNIFVCSYWFYSFTSLNRIDWKLLIPAPCNQQIIIGIKFLRAELQSPNWINWLLNKGKFITIFVSQQNLTIKKSDSKYLSVRRPISTQTFKFCLKLLYICSFSLP